MLSKLMKMLDFSLENYQKMMWGKSSFKGLLLGLASYFIVVDFYNLVLFLLLFCLFKWQDLNKIFVFELVMSEVIVNDECLVDSKYSLLLFKKSNILFGGNKAKKGAIATLDAMRFFNGKIHEFKNPMNKMAADHPVTVQLLYNSESELQLMMSNYTTSDSNAVKIAETGELHETSQVYMYNEFSLILLKERGAQIDILNQLKLAKKMNLFNKKLYGNQKVKLNVRKILDDSAETFGKGSIYDTNDLVGKLQVIVDNNLKDANSCLANDVND